MDTLQEKDAFKNLPFREDGTIDINEMMRRELERMVNQIMDWQAGLRDLGHAGRQAGLRDLGHTGRKESPYEEGGGCGLRRRRGFRRRRGLR